MKSVVIEPMNAKTLSEKPAPKVPVAVAGHLERRFVRCGTPGCHCAHGSKHGVYYRIAVWHNGRRTRRYVPVDEVDQLRCAIVRWRQEREEHRAVRRRARDLHARLRAFGRLADELMCRLEGSDA